MIADDVKLDNRNHIKSLLFRSNEEPSIVSHTFNTYKTLITSFLYIYIE